MDGDSNWLTADEHDLRATATGLLDRIPGYRGYRDKEGRRDADRLIREETASNLERAAGRVQGVARGLANQRRITDVGPVSSLADAVSHLADRVRTASYGYAPLFSDRSIDEQALDQLRRFDEGLLGGIDELTVPIAGLESALADGGDLAVHVRGGQAVVATLGGRLDLRGQVMSSGTPAAEESVVAVLATEPPPEPHPSLRLNRGDAVSVFGDDFVVDARIDVVAGEDSLRLFRLHAGPPGRWLLTSINPAIGFADVTEQAGQGAATDPPSTVTGSGTGEISGTGDASGRRAVRFRVWSDGTESGVRSLDLDWGAEQLSFSGRSVHPDDIEVFPATPNP